MRYFASVRSPIVKLRSAGLAVGSVTTSEFLVLYVILRFTVEPYLSSATVNEPSTYLRPPDRIISCPVRYPVFAILRLSTYFFCSTTTVNLHNCYVGNFLGVPQTLYGDASGDCQTWICGFEFLQVRFGCPCPICSGQYNVEKRPHPFAQTHVDFGVGIMSVNPIMAGRIYVSCQYMIGASAYNLRC